MVAHTYNPSTQEAGQRDRGEFELGLGYRCEFQVTFTRVVTRCLKQTKSKRLRSFLLLQHLKNSLHTQM